MNVSATSLKDFTMNFYNSSNGNVLTYIKVIAEEPGAKAANAEPEGDEKPTDKKVIFDTTTSIVFHKGTYMGLLNAQDTKAYNLISKKTKFGQIDVKDIQTKDYFIENCSLEIVHSVPSKKIDLKNDRILCDIKITADFKIDHLESDNKDLNGLINSQNIPKELKDALSAEMKTIIEQMLETVKGYDSDIFEIEKTLFKFHPKKYRAYKKNHPDNFLQNTDFNITIELNPVSN